MLTTHQILTLTLLVSCGLYFAAGYAPATAPHMSLREAAACKPRSAVDTTSISRRSLLLGIGIGIPAASFAEEAATETKPKDDKKKKNAAAEKARLEEEAQQNAEAFDASLGLFGCSFWGLEKKPNSGACQPKGTGAK